MTHPPKFTMPFDAMTIEHLGLRLYSHLPPVIAELVSNAYDADSREVEVTLPTGAITPSSEVVVRDYGHAMTAEELQREYLPIGRCRRGADGATTKSKSGVRVVTGRKGLGKLSSFGVADQMELRSVKDGLAICLRFSFTAMKHWAESKPPGTPYEPEFVSARSGATKDRDGVEVRLRGLRRKSGISSDDVRRGLARRLLVFGPEFVLKVNGATIQPSDRNLRDACVSGEVWDVSALPGGGTVKDALTVSGWIGFLPSSSQTYRGVDIFAHGKAAELGSYFNYPSTHAQFARAHLVGEVHADFLDEGEDRISTARNSVVWESDEGVALQQWGESVLKFAFQKWLDSRRDKKKERITKLAGFDQWMKGRPEPEQRVALKLVKLLVDDDQIEEGSAEPLLEIVKSSVESVAFRELVDAIEAEGANPKTLVKLFDDWRIIEAREHLKLADGRRAAVEQLEKFIDEGALEVQELQPLFEANPWMIDQSWIRLTGQTKYTDLLRKKCPEPKDTADEDRRMDILGVSAGEVLTVVELKRPQKTLSRKDLEQIEAYVDWARENLADTGESVAPRFIKGRLIVGKMNGALKDKVKRLAGDDIRVETFRDLHERSKRYYDEVDVALQSVAPEYSRSKRRQSKKP